MTDATFTFRVEDELKQAFGKAAKAQDQSGAQLLRAFMRDFVKRQAEAADHDTWFRREVEKGLASANAGRLVDNEDVERQFASRRAKTMRKLGNS